MNSPRIPAALALLSALGAGAAFGATIATPQQRQASVELAERLTRPAPAVPAPAELKSPFSPPDFDRPASDEEPNKGGAPDKKAPDSETPAGPGSNREVLESLAQLIPNASTITLGAKSYLLLPKSPRLQVGDFFTVTHPVNKQDYELELAAITSTTFTLRYHGEEVTRPLKSAK